jgi:cysteinyl-tRNA synthetase
MTTLRLHNTLTRKTEDFTPLHDHRVHLYTCGPTVYNYPTVGNWVANIYWDTLVRTLIANGYDVTRVMNITDVGHLTSDADEGEDKLEKGARSEGKTAWEVAKFYTRDFIDGMEQLGMIMPTYMPRATEYIPQQLELIRKLKEKGYTYQIDDGIYFDTSKFPTYADFAGLDLEAQRAGARVEYNTEKRNPSDFALWKFTPVDEKRDMEWETPADLLEGDQKEQIMGFPGWHLECSAMAMDLLGTTIDIHTGGIDHIPVHHTNEIAQSEGASGQLFSRFWLHCNHLKVNGTKISKSLGNGYTLQDLEGHGFSPLDFRMFALQGHYSNEGNFTFENLEAARNRRQKWRAVAALRWQVQSDQEIQELDKVGETLLDALNDNLNTPEALRIIDETFTKLEALQLQDISPESLARFLKTIDDLLGLQLLMTTPDIDASIQQLITQREQARTNKDWAQADELREQLQKQNIALRDTSDGNIWEYIN